jgi:DNA (cytosine-5)-methyltransferase 1
MSGRPAYRVPTLAEIARIPWNGFTVASLFAGGGGSSTGYRMAGYRVAYANDVVPEARETYEANCAPYTVVDGDDVRTVPGSRILDAVEAMTGSRQLDVLDGSPPCQAFSMAGPRDGTWGREVAHADGTTQRSDDLFFEYARILEEVRPTAFVAENVPGLVKSVSRGYFKRILAALRATGYLVEARLLDAQWLGVPQTRQRLIFVGVRNDVGLGPAFPAPLPWFIPLSEICPDVVRVEIFGYGIVKEIRDARKAPSNTILASGYSACADAYDLVCADGRRRKLTIEEVRRIGSFPSDYRFSGGHKQVWTRIGNSVPPLMMKAVAETVRERILDQARTASHG